MFFLLAPFATAQQRSIINPGFEQPGVPVNTFQLEPQANVPGWNTTDSLGEIEIWGSGFNGVTSSEGVNFAELNANSAGFLYQNICMTNGEQVGWTFNHRRRSAFGTETAQFVIQNLAGTADIQVLATQTSSNNLWNNNSGITTYTGPTGVQRVGFRAVGGGSSGNFLDAIQIEFAVYAELTSTSTTLGEGLTAGLPAITLSGKLDAPVTFNVADNGTGTATPGVDYVLASNTITIPAGNYSGETFNLPVTVFNDGLVEGNETIVLSISSPSNPEVLIADIQCSGTPATTATHTITDVPAADLELAYTIDNASPQAGDTVNLTVSVTNANPAGGHSATGIQIDVPLPAGLSLTGNTPSQGSYAGNNWTLGTLAAGQSASLTLTATVTGTSGANYSATAQVSAMNEIDPDSTPGNSAGEDDEDTVSFTVSNVVTITSAPALCLNQNGTLLGPNIFTAYDNGTFGTASGAPNDVATANPYAPIANYTFSPDTNITVEGEYAYIGNSTSFIGWPATVLALTDPDNGPTGRALYINGSANAGTFFSQTLTGLTPNTNYELSMWYGEIFAGPNQLDTAILSFKVNGVEYYNTGPMVRYNSPTWTRGGFVFNSGNSTTATVTVEMTNPGTTGRDFGIDNITARQCSLPIGSVSGRVYVDNAPQNNTYDAGEADLANIKVQLIDNQADADPANDIVVAESDTLADGTYSFTNVPLSANYILRVDTADTDLPAYLAGLGTSNDVPINLATNGQSITGQNFGFDTLPPYQPTLPVKQCQMNVSSWDLSVPALGSENNYSFTTHGGWVFGADNIPVRYNTPDATASLVEGSEVTDRTLAAGTGPAETHLITQRIEAPPGSSLTVDLMQPVQNTFEWWYYALRDSSGNVLATSSPAGQVSIANTPLPDLTVTVPADGIVYAWSWVADFNGVFSTPQADACGTVTGVAFDDNSGDGVYNPGTDIDYSNITITATRPGPDATFGTADDELFSSVQTGSPYTTEVPPGQVRVAIDPNDPNLPAGATLTTPASVDITAAAATSFTTNFGIAQVGTLSGSVFEDADLNGALNGETQFPNISVTAFTAGPDATFGTADDVSVGTTQTSATAPQTYSFTLPGGDYELRYDYTDPDLPAIQQAAGPTRRQVTLPAGGTINGLDFATFPGMTFPCPAGNSTIFTRLSLDSFTFTTGTTGRYNDVGLAPDGTPLDLLVDITNATANLNTFGVSNDDGLILFGNSNQPSTATVKYTAVIADTATPVALNMLFSVADIDETFTRIETVRLGSTIQNIGRNDPSWLSIGPAPGGENLVTGTQESTSGVDPEAIVNFSVTNESEFTITYGAQYKPNSTGGIGAAGYTLDGNGTNPQLANPACSPFAIADLSLQKTFLPAAPVDGDTMTFTLVVESQGPNDADNVAVTDLLPAGLTYVSDSSGGVAGAPVDYDPATGVWSLGTVLAGTTRRLDIVATVSGTSAITNIAEITASDAGDPDSVPGAGAANGITGDDGLDGDPNVIDDDEASVTFTPTPAAITASGTIFTDNGTGAGAAAHNGLIEGNEAGLEGITIEARVGGTVIATAQTDGNGAYTLSLPASTAGSPVTMQVGIIGADYRHISGSPGALPVLTDPDATDGMLDFVPALGGAYANINFGVAKRPRLTEDRNMSITEGGQVLFTHVFTSESAMSVDFALAGEVQSSPGAFTTTFIHDADCNGQIDAGEGALAGPYATVAGEQTCLVIRATTAPGTALGTTLGFDIVASGTYANTAVPFSRTNHDTLIVSASGSLQLSKTVCNATASTCNLGTGTGFGQSNSGAPGDIVIYRITFTAPGDGPIDDVSVVDATPAYSSLTATAPGIVQVPNGPACSLTEPAVPASGYTGQIKWDCPGAMAAGDQGIVSFEVRIDN